MEDDSEEIHILKSPEEIYALPDQSQKLSYFYNSNRIISSPVPTFNFFKGFTQYSREQQEKILK